MQVDAARAIAFPSWAWDDVFGGQFLARSATEYRRWNAALRDAVPEEDRWLLPTKWRRRLERSWGRLFEDLPERAWGGHGRVLGWSLEGREAVMETIRAEDIRETTLFRGASSDLALVAFHRHKRRLLDRHRIDR